MVYSKFGYFLLGRVIETVSGQSYTDYVHQNVLSRRGISNMHFGGSTLAERRADEAQYFSDGWPEPPYNMNVPRMDANGAWIASSIDYARFLARVDGLAIRAGNARSAMETMMWTIRNSVQAWPSYDLF